MKILTEMKKKPWPALVIMAVVLGILGWQTIQYFRMTHTLKKLSPSTVREVRIRKGTSHSTSSFTKFQGTEALVQDLVTALHDVHFFLGDAGGVMSPDHSWFVEIETDSEQILGIDCHLPARIDHLAVGSPILNGQYLSFDIQSKQLYLWYQKHSIAWGVKPGEEIEISIGASE